MNVNKKVLSSLLIATMAFSTGFLFQQTTPTQAKTSIKVIWRHKTKQTSYKIDKSKAKKAYAYSAKLGSKKFKLAAYANKTFKVSYQQKIRINGKYRLYYYAKNSSNKKIAGWIWRGYLSKVQKTASSSSNQSNSSATNNNESNNNSNSGVMDNSIALSAPDLNDLITASPDLDPNSKLLTLSAATYAKYPSTFNTQFNLSQFADSGVFVNHQATIYVADSQLVNYVDTAINNWNNALGRQVFVLGTQANHTLTVKFGDGSAQGWDGLFSGNTVEVDTNNFNDPTYGRSGISLSPQLAAKLSSISNQSAQLTADTNAQIKKNRTNYENQYAALQQKLASATTSAAKAAVQRQLAVLKSTYEQTDQSLRDSYNDQIEQLRQAVQYAYQDAATSAGNQQITNYWATVIMHELGHALGLYHTPYQNDVMYAPVSDEPDATPSPVKYSWTSPVDPNDPKAYQTGQLSSRDVDRAKLTGALG